jgi:hypothetical protein
MNFTPGDIVLILSALGVVIVNIIAALKNNRLITEVSAKADLIAGHVNSTATAQASKIDSLQSEVTLLRSLLSDKSQVAAVLAQSVAVDKAKEIKE